MNKSFRKAKANFIEAVRDEAEPREKCAFEKARRAAEAIRNEAREWKEMYEEAEKEREALEARLENIRGILRQVSLGIRLRCNMAPLLGTRTPTLKFWEAKIDTAVGETF